MDKVRSAFLFDGPVRDAILRLKFSGDRSVAEALGGAMAAAVAPANVGAITWVPLSRARLSERGYDQARALALVVARRWRLPASPLLVRTRDAPPQAKRSGAERREALRGAFEAKGSPPPRVLLVDDVLTTGSTTAECSVALRRAGAGWVEVLTSARAIRRSGSRGRSGGH